MFLLKMLVAASATAIALAASPPAAAQPQRIPEPPRPTTSTALRHTSCGPAWGHGGIHTHVAQGALDHVAETALCSG